MKSKIEALKSEDKQRERLQNFTNSFVVHTIRIIL